MRKAESDAEDIKSEIFKKLYELAPAFVEGDEHNVAFISPHDPTRLVELERHEPGDTVVTLTQTIQSGGHRPITDISMDLHINVLIRAC